MDRRAFLTASAGLLAGAVLRPGAQGWAQEAAAAPKRKPNVILILADDLGWAELGCQGGSDIPTPHIDSIARNGVRFTDGHVSCPLCSPTRAGLLTGRYQQRFGHEFNPGPATAADAEFGLPLSEATIADRFKSQGYKTGMFGKWHLGYKPEFHPLKRGFDEFYGFLGGAHDYRNVLSGKADPILRGTEPVKEIDYTTEAFAREAVAFIEKHAQEPFFVYLPFNAVHGPLQAPQKYLDRFTSIENVTRRTFAAMLSALDDAVGSVLAKLDELKLSDDTILLFLSDNGGPTPKTTSGNKPLHGFKAQMYEGGIRIPFMLQWKGHLPAGKVYESPVISLDILPTALAAAGVSIDPEWKLDGVNLLPYLNGEKPEKPHETLYWRMGDQHAVRHGQWKLVHAKGAANDELYDLTADLSEAHDCATAQPEKLKELQQLYNAWNAQLAEPRWKGAGEKRPARRRQRAK